MKTPKRQSKQKDFASRHELIESTAEVQKPHTFDELQAISDKLIQIAKDNEVGMVACLYAIGKDKKKTTTCLNVQNVAEYQLAETVGYMIKTGLVKPGTLATSLFNLES